MTNDQPTNDWQIMTSDVIVIANQKNAAELTSRLNFKVN